jgi:hypothetical protein
MPIRNKQIVIASNEGWGDIWYSKHNYAFELSRTNEVIFLNPCTRWRLKNLWSFNTSFQSISPGLQVMTYTNILPALNSWLFFLNNKLVSKKIKQKLKEINFSDFLFWNFDPHRLCDPAALGAAKSVYHCVDKYDLRHFGEGTLCRKSDHIFIISEVFRETYSKLNPSVFLMPHGISKDEFTPEPEVPGPALHAILYIGIIDKRLDFDLIEKALIRFPDQRFTFIGGEVLEPENAAARRIFVEKKYPNMTALGVVPFKKIKNLLAQAQCCIAFMNRKHNGNLISHHKIFQYLALGKPIFSCQFSEYKTISHLLYMNDEPEGLLQSLSAFLAGGEDPSLAQERIRYASNFRFDILLDEAGKFLYPAESTPS